jgi:RNA 2',3'-cyclic 3'-phosphodiesterase
MTADLSPRAKPSNLEPPPSGERLFVALTLPLAVRDALVALAEPIRGVAWTRPEQLHITLRFLGHVPLDKIEPMIARLEGVRVEPFVLPVEGIGSFPPGRPPRILWAGVGRGHPRLFQLRQRLDDTLLASGIDLDVRTFHAHATLARCTENATTGVNQWLHAHENFEGPPFRVEAFDLYASELRPSGAVHTLRRRFPLSPS